LTLKEFLSKEKWMIYRVDLEKRLFFGDTFFGPMWKTIPEDVELPGEAVDLSSAKKVEEYLNV
jgi:hypothetical protein